MRLAFLFAFLGSTLAAKSPFPYWPGSTYDTAIPTEKSVLGHDPGERISNPEEIVRYMRALAASAPTRMKVVTYGRTWEGRELIYAAIGSETNIAHLAEIQSATQRVADPRKISAFEAKPLMQTLPAIVWLAYGVHGNEISSPDAALVTAYHLLAAKDDKLTSTILNNDLVLIDPLQNPDGRNRFIHNYETAEGLEPDPSQAAAEHNEPWPGGRTNHYYFDMNRDWFAMTQPETRGRIAAVRSWLPLVFVDLHEMGSDSTYYFAPEANPYNPYITQVQKDSLEWFGKTNARYFDQLGFSYFTKEGYDEFYPGYGASWPLYYGGIGMTYEQASTRGLVVQKADGSTVEYADTVRRHFTTSIATLETAAAHRQELWQNFYRYRQEALEEGRRSDIREYILVRDGNTNAVDKLASNLAEQGIEVFRATAGLDNAGASYPSGSYVLPLAQPGYRLLRALLDTQVSMDPKFLAGEEERRTARQPSEMYDVTAWSLPMQAGVHAVATREKSNGSLEALPAHFHYAGHVTGTAHVAYLVAWGTSGSGHFLAGALREGVRIATIDKPFVQNGQHFPAGTLVIKVKENPSNIGETVAKLAADSGADVIATDTGWMDEGPNFGSRQVIYLPQGLKIAMAWDRPTSASAAGAARYALEREFGYPVTVIRTSQVGATDLGPFKVLLLPDTGFGSDNYESTLGVGGVRRLHEWVSNGGTLVALGPGAVNFLAASHVSMLSTAQEDAAHAAAPTKTGDKTKAKAGADAEGSQATASAASSSGRVPGKLIASDQEYRAAIQAGQEMPDSLHGVLLRARVDSHSWLSAGVPQTVNVMVTGRAIFSPLTEEHGVNVSHFEAPDKILASGFMWEPNRLQLAYKPFVMLEREGRGNVIGFTCDPVFRGYMDGLNVLLLNAVFRGPAHAGVAGGFGAEE